MKETDEEVEVTKELRRKKTEEDEDEEKKELYTIIAK